MLKDSGSHPKLTLIDCGGNGNSDAGFARPESVAQFDDAQALRIEAGAFEARHGKTPYSDFILKHGRRPDQNEAAGMGRMMNLRLRAADGTLQPRLTKTEKAAWKRFHRQTSETRKKTRELRRLNEAIRDLSAAQISPAELALETGDAIGGHAKRALDYLSRVAKELCDDEAGKSPRST